MNYTSVAPWSRRTTWISSLITGALKTSSNKLSQELKLFKKIASWNGFPKCVVNSTFRKTHEAHQDKGEPNLTEKQKEPVVIYFRFSYYGDRGFQQSPRGYKYVK